MGASESKDELVYQEVLNGNQNAVKTLRRQGASLEWVDKEGRTPLILSCTRGELLEMAVTLLQLGANIKAYRPGTHGGFPMHHAAKRGLVKTVELLLYWGADGLAINDDGLTPLDMARNRGHVAVVRLFEERLAVFRGALRELSGLGILETLMPNLVTKKIWAVVLPTELNPRRIPKYELVIYQSSEVAQPRTTILLTKAELEPPKFNSPDPVLYITDKTNKTKYKLLSENEGDKAQLARLYQACLGISQATGEDMASPIHNEPQAHPNPTGIPPQNIPPHPNASCSYSELSPSNILPPPLVSDLPAPSAPPLPQYPSLDNAPLHNPVVDTSPIPEVANNGKKVEEKLGGVCVICLDAPAEGVCVPCGHIAGCMSCLGEVESKKWGCPVCRSPIQQVIKVYSV